MGYIKAILLSIVLCVGSAGIFALPVLLAWCWWFSTMPKALAIEAAEREAAQGA